MNHHESQFDPSALPLGDELEARVVAWVAGELPPAEAAELERLAAGNPAIALFRRRMEAIQGLVAEAERAETEPLRLSLERRAQLLRTLGGTPAAPAPAGDNVVALPQHPSRWSWRNAQIYYGVAGMAAACLVMLFVWERRQPVMYTAKATMQFEKPEAVLTTADVTDPAVRNDVDMNTYVQMFNSTSTLGRPGVPTGATMQTEEDGKRKAEGVGQDKALMADGSAARALAATADGHFIREAPGAGGGGGAIPAPAPAAPAPILAQQTSTATGPGNNIYLSGAATNVQGGTFLSGRFVGSNEPKPNSLAPGGAGSVSFGTGEPVAVNLNGPSLVGGMMNMTNNGRSGDAPAAAVAADRREGVVEEARSDISETLEAQMKRRQEKDRMLAEAELQEAKRKNEMAQSVASNLSGGLTLNVRSSADNFAAVQAGRGAGAQTAGGTITYMPPSGDPVNFTGAGGITSDAFKKPDQDALQKQQNESLAYAPAPKSQTGAVSEGATLNLSATNAPAGKPLSSAVKPSSYGGSITLAAPNSPTDEDTTRLDAFAVNALREGQAIGGGGGGGRARAFQEQAGDVAMKREAFAPVPALGVAQNRASWASADRVEGNLSLVNRDARSTAGVPSASTGAIVSSGGSLSAPAAGGTITVFAGFGDTIITGNAIGSSTKISGDSGASAGAQVSKASDLATGKGKITLTSGGNNFGGVLLRTANEAGQTFAGTTVPSMAVSAAPAAAAAAATTTVAGVIAVPSMKQPDAPRPASAPKPLPAVTEVATAVEPVSTFSLHVADVSFRLAQAALARGERPDPARIRAEEFYNAFDYGDPAPTAAEKIGARVEQAGHPFLPQRNLVRVALRVASDGRGATPLHLTVLLDTSGSMEREDRAAAVRRALEVLVSLLGPNDRITLIGFARTPRLLAENIAGDRARSLLDILNRTPSEGGTNLEEAIKLGGELAHRHFAAGAQNRVVLLTDGAANLGDADPAQLGALVEMLRQQNLSFDACGVGLDGLDDEVLESLTRRGDGRYYALNSPADADTGFAQKLAGALRPAAENVKVQVRFNPARVGHYRLIGFEQHRLREQDFRNDAVNAAELAADENAVALYQVELLPGGEGELGELFVRFRDPATAQMVERAWTLPYEAAAPAFDRATPTLQLAGASALLAEKFRGGVGEPVKFSELAKVSALLRGRYAQDARVQQFVTMIAQAQRLYGDAP